MKVANFSLGRPRFLVLLAAFWCGLISVKPKFRTKLRPSIRMRIIVKAMLLRLHSS